MSKIKIALIGIGNCASSLIQGVLYYRNLRKKEKAVGLRNLFLGKIHPRDIQIVASFDIDSRKVGKDLAKAIFSPPNNTLKFVNVPTTNVIVNKGPVLDGISGSTKKIIKVSKLPIANVTEILRKSNAEIVINLLPSGALRASRWYANQALNAGCAFINVNPVFIASDTIFAKRFKDAKLPIVGDDLLDQAGGTILNKIILNFLSNRGIRITKTYQLDVGGGVESLETLERTRNAKKSVITKSIESTLPYKADIVAGSTDYVDFLENRRETYLWIEGFAFCKSPIQIDLKLSTVDGPNSGSVLIDTIRAVKIALEKKMSGAILPICAYAFKHPPKPISLEKTEKEFFKFIKNNT